jgi:hypothetical protein
MMKIKLPDYADNTEVTEGDKLIAFARIAYDECPPNPCEDWDGFGTFYLLGKCHSNFDEQCLKLLEDKDAVGLSYYEHGDCMWFVADSSVPAGVEFQWDGVRLAGVWEPDDIIKQTADDKKLKTGTDERRQWMVDQAVDACEVYTWWCNGEVYSYDIRVYNKRQTEDGATYDELNDYRHDEPVHEDSCSGYYGQESIDEAIKAAATALELEIN